MFTGMRPFIRTFTDDAPAGGGENKDERGYPADTPVKDMTPDQKAAYHEYHARKHENRVKAYGDWTPDKIRALEQERDALKNGSQSDADKAIEAAREEGRNELRSVLNKERATVALEKALQGRVPAPAALLGLDVNKFIVNGNLDTDAVKAWVEDNSDEAPTAAKKAPDLGQGRRGTTATGQKSVAAGRDLYADRHKKKTNTTS